MVAGRLAASLLLLVAVVSSGAQLAEDGPPEALRSPRATLRTFIEAMNEGDRELARSTLDLSEVDAIVREQQGERIAAALLDVINRTRFVELTRVPDYQEGGPYVFSRYDQDRLKIEIAQQQDGAWRFTPETVAQIDEIFEYVRNEGWEVKEDPRTGLRPEEVELLRAHPALWMKERVPERWQAPVLGLPVYNYIGLVALALVAFLAGFVVRFLTRLIVRSSLHIDEDIADKRDLKSLGRAIGLILNVEILEAGLPFLELPYFVTSPAYFVLRLLSAVGWYWFLCRVWDIGVALVARRASGRNRSTHKVVVPVVGKFGRFLIFIGVTIVFIAQIGYDVRALLAGLGIGGLVLALAAKDSVENLFGSVTILMEMPFGVGDWVKIGDIDGTVEEINLRSTRIRTFEDSLITMPNSRMITSHVENYGARRRRRLRTTLGITYDTPPDKVEAFCQRIRDMLSEHPNVWEEKRFVFFNDFGASTLDVLLYCFIEAPTWDEELAIRDDILRRVLVISQEMGVEFAFPTTTMQIKGDTSQLKPSDPLSGQNGA